MVSEADDLMLLVARDLTSQQTGENGEKAELVGEASEYMIARR